MRYSTAALGAFAASAASVGQGIQIIPWSGKPRQIISYDLRLVKDQLLASDTKSAKEYTDLVRNYIFGCFMAKSSVPNMRGAVVNDQTTYSDVAAMYQSDIFSCWNDINGFSEILIQQEKFKEAIVLREEGLKILEIDYASPADTRVSNVLKASQDLGKMHFGMGNYAAAKTLFSKAAGILTMMDIQNEEVANILHTMAVAEFKEGKYSDAVATYTTVVDYFKRFGSSDAGAEPGALSSLAACYYQLNDFASAEQRYSEAVKAYSTMKGEKPILQQSVAMKNLGLVQYALKKYVSAATNLEESLQLFFSTGSDSNEFNKIVDVISEALYFEADSVGESGDKPKAASIRHRANQIRSHWTKVLTDSGRKDMIDKIMTQSKNEFKLPEINLGVSVSKETLGMVVAAVVGLAVIVMLFSGKKDAKPPAKKSVAAPPIDDATATPKPATSKSATKSSTPATPSPSSGSGNSLSSSSLPPYSDASSLPKAGGDDGLDLPPQVIVVKTPPINKNAKPLPSE
jgi:tetratricopeptide (TPR) repeat protein